MFVLRLKDPTSKERLMEREQSLEKTLQASRIYSRNKQTAHEVLKRREQPSPECGCSGQKRSEVLMGNAFWELWY